MQVALDHLVELRAVAPQQRGVVRRQGQVERSVLGRREGGHGEKEQRQRAHPTPHFFFFLPSNFQSLFISLMSASVSPEARYIFPSETRRSTCNSVKRPAIHENK